MEFSFSVNPLLNNGITILDRTMMPNRSAQDRTGNLRSQLFEVVDKMGEASATAQGLHGAITSGRKMELSDHKLYIMKDQEGLSDKGSVVGILKTGKKKLFVYDLKGQQHEMEPLCVLDFYVHESRQRTGCGKRLFEHMLQNENIQPYHLAVDRPSHKFSSFLAKHYNLKTQIPQTNNFVIYDGFLSQKDCSANRKKSGYRIYNGYFINDSSGPSDKSNGNNSNQYNSTGNYGSRPPSGSRFTRPPSGKSIKNQVYPDTNNHQQINVGNRPPSGRNRSAVNSRPSSGNLSNRPPSEGNYGNRPPSGGNYGNRPPSGGNYGNRPPSGRRKEETSSVQQQQQIQAAIKDLNLIPRSQTTLYNSHHSQNQKDQLQPPVNSVYSRHNPNLLRKTPSPQTGNCNNNQDQPKPFNEKFHPGISPHNFNLHQDYQGRSGHLKMNPVTGVIQETSLPKINSAGSNRTMPAIWGGTPSQETSWTVGNIYQNLGLSNRQYNRHRYW